ncbi:hypothetical protein OS187_08750 [Xanthomonadaceae bacterium JHOS43]|nr:hypothetical protein [Xanthomonadaceae bacterium JHOS43]
MARYEHLPIWHDAMRLAVHLERSVARFPRYHKYTLGTELRRGAQSLLGAIMRCASARETRTAELERLVLIVEQVKTQLALAREVRVFASFNDFAQAASGGNPPAAPSFDLRSLVQPFDACRRGKKTTDETIRYAAHLLDHLLATRDALAGFSWKPSRSRAFVCTRPKLREIHAAPFGDRVVHHLLVQQWERLYEPVFIFDSYANRRGKGTHAAVNRLQAMMRSLRGSDIAGTAKPASAQCPQRDACAERRLVIPACAGTTALSALSREHWAPATSSGRMGWFAPQRRALLAGAGGNAGGG